MLFVFSKNVKNKILLKTRLFIHQSFMFNSPKKMYIHVSHNINEPIFF